MRVLGPLLLVPVQAAVQNADVGPSASGAHPVEILAGSDPACETLRKELTDHWAVNGFDEEPDWRNVYVEFPGELGDTQEADLDFYNDGMISRVFMSSYGSQDMLGTSLLVQHGRSSTKVDVAISDPLEDPDAWFIPCQLQGKRIPVKDCPPFSEENGETGLTVSWANRTQHVHFRGRYSDVVPVRLNNTTFIIVTGSAAESIGYAAVLKPLPIRTFRTTCLLHRR